MLAVFVEVLIPVFAIVAVGFVLARFVNVEPRTLASIAYWVLGPAFVFDVLSTAELDPGVVIRVVGATLITMLVIGLLSALLARLAGASFSRIAATVVTSIYGNVGNFGLAINAFAFGAAVLPIAGIVMVTTNTVGIITGVGLATLRHQPVWRSAWTALLSPIAIAVWPALFVNVTNAGLPLWLERPVSLLSTALIPMMLLTIGIQIAGMPRRWPARMSVIPVSLKLILAPAVALVATLVLGLTGRPADVVVLQAAMPAAVFTSLIALEHELDADYVTSVVLIGTIISIVTLPIVISLR